MARVKLSGMINFQPVNVCTNIKLNIQLHYYLYIYNTSYQKRSIKNLARCPELPIREGRKISYSNALSAGSEVTITCNPIGYQLVGKKSAICEIQEILLDESTIALSNTMDRSFFNVELQKKRDVAVWSNDIGTCQENS